MVTSRPKIIKSFDHPMDIRIRYVDYKFGSDRGARELSRVSRANFVSFFGSTTGFPSKTLVFRGFSRCARGKTWRVP